jgi:hypothetical protein
MIGPVIVAVAAIVLVVGMVVVVWEWSVSSNPDAPHGGSVIGIALAALLCGAVVSCGETMKDVQELKRSAAHGTKP